MADITVQGDLLNLPGKGSPQAGPIYSLNPPNNGDFSWVNQGGASITDIGGGALALTIPAQSTGSMRIRKEAAPSTPYNIEFAFLSPLVGANYNGVGFLWRESSSEKLVGVFYSATADGLFIAVNKYDNATTFVSQSVIQKLVGGFGSPFFLKLGDDGTNRHASFSADGQTWTEFYSEGRTSFMTADQVGFGGDTNTNQWPLTMTVLNWDKS